MNLFTQRTGYQRPHFYAAHIPGVLHFFGLQNFPHISTIFPFETFYNELRKFDDELNVGTINFVNLAQLSNGGNRLRNHSAWKLFSMSDKTLRFEQVVAILKLLVESCLHLDGRTQLEMKIQAHFPTCFST